MIRSRKVIVWSLPQIVEHCNWGWESTTIKMNVGTDHSGPELGAEKGQIYLNSTSSLKLMKKFSGNVHWLSVEKLYY